MARIRGARIVLTGVAALATAGSIGVSAAGAARPAPKVSVAATPSSLKADGTSTSRIVVKIRVGARPERNALVTLTLTATTAGACGSLSASSGHTNRSGIFATTYKSSTTSGFCSISAAVGTRSAATTIDQTSTVPSAKDSIALAAQSTTLGAGASTMLTVHVDNAGTPVSSDPVTITATPLEPGACGTIIMGATTTDSNGQVTASYQAPSTAGICNVRAAEANTGAKSNVVVIHERTGPPIV